VIKKTTLLLATICLISNSCTTDIEINTPGLQATIDGKLFRPDIRKAIIHDDGSLEIVGLDNGIRKMMLNSSLKKGLVMDKLLLQKYLIIKFQEILPFRI